MMSPALPLLYERLCSPSKSATCFAPRADSHCQSSHPHRRGSTVHARSHGWHPTSSAWSTMLRVIERVPQVRGVQVVAQRKMPAVPVQQGVPVRGRIEHVAQFVRPLAERELDDDRAGRGQRLQKLVDGRHLARPCTHAAAAWRSELSSTVPLRVMGAANDSTTASAPRRESDCSAKTKRRSMAAAPNPAAIARNSMTSIANRAGTRRPSNPGTC